MERKTTITFVKRLIMYWLTVSITSSLCITCLSCFVPYEYFQTYIRDGFYSLVYFRLTFLFFFFIAGIIALPGFLLNLCAYFCLKKSSNLITTRCLAIWANILTGSVVLYFYYKLNISQVFDFYCFILPGYIVPIVLWGMLMLPAKPFVNE